MIVSHSNRFIFIKTKKTAGSSVEIALSRFCGPGDIVLPISKEEDEFREREYGVRPANFEYLAPRSGFSLPFRVLEGAFVDPRGFVDFLRQPGSRSFPWKRKRYARHIRAKDLRRRIEKTVWENYLKVTVERNPWDKAVSRYYWDLHFGGRVDGRSLEEHIEYLAEKKPLQLSNWRMYAENRRILVDRVILYEDLASELRKLGEDLGIDRLELPAYRAKSNSRKDTRPAAEVLSDNAKSIIAQVCANEIESFDYVCDERAIDPLTEQIRMDSRFGRLPVIGGIGFSVRVSGFSSDTGSRNGSRTQITDNH